MIYTQLRNAITVSSSPSMTTEDFEIIPQFDYAYDAAGRRVSIVKSGSAFGDLSGSVDSYAYNDRSELTSARRTKNGQPIPGFSEDFDYDPIGNRRSSATYNEKGVAQTSTYQANNLNQYTQRTTPGYAAVRGEADPAAFVTVNENPTFRLGSYYFGSDLFDNSRSGRTADLQTYAVKEGVGQGVGVEGDGEDLISSHSDHVSVPQSPESFAYDDDGNQTLITTATGRWRVTYNGENRPILWVRDSDNTTIVMSYDHKGRRREKNDQRFFYDAYLQVADNGGNVYTWDCTEPVATRPLAWHRGNSSDFYTHDGNKNVSEVIAAVGAFAAHYEYAPFGAVTTQLGALVVANPWRFSSEYAEDDTATVYYNYRHYEPVSGRWMERYPIEERGSINLFCFVLNACDGSFDYLGMDSCASGSFNNVRIHIAPTSQAYAANLSQLEEDAKQLLTALGSMGKAFEYTSLATSGGVTALMWAIVENGASSYMGPGTSSYSSLFSKIFDILLHKTPIRLDGVLRYEKCVCAGIIFKSLKYVEQSPVEASIDVPFENMNDEYTYAKEYKEKFNELTKDLIKKMYEELRK